MMTVYDFPALRARSLVLASAIAAVVYVGLHAWHGHPFAASAFYVILPIVLAAALRPTIPVFLIALWAAMQVPFLLRTMPDPLVHPALPSDLAALIAGIAFFLFARFHSFLFLRGSERVRYAAFLQGPPWWFVPALAGRQPVVPAAPTRRQVPQPDLDECALAAYAYQEAEEDWELRTNPINSWHVESVWYRHVGE